MHSCKLKKIKNANRLGFDLKIDLDDGDRITCNLDFHGKSDDFKMALMSTEAIFDKHLGPDDVDLKTADNKEIIILLGKMCDAMKEDNDTVKTFFGIEV